MLKPISVSWIVAIVLGGVVLAPAPARATPLVEFTFDGGAFANGTRTPIVAAPNITPYPGATFFGAFVDAANADGFGVTTPVLAENFTGNSLFTPFGDPLTVIFNKPVDLVTVDFAIGVLDIEAPGFLRLVSSQGTFNQISSDVGGLFQGGTLSFMWDRPFVNTFTLQAFRADGEPIMFEIDSLRVDVAAAPEPSTVVLLGLGLSILVRRRFGSSRALGVQRDARERC
jgi:PEP-CTERM motif-containing protein